VSDDPFLGVRRYELDLDDQRTVVRTEYYAVDAFMETNAALRNESDGKRFGDGQVVASVPLHIWAREIAPRRQDGNDVSLKRWLNNSDNRAFRTFRGKV
jgi:hypothetical protein